MYLWLDSICFVKFLYKSEFSQLVYFLQPLKVLPSSAYRLGRPYERWAKPPFVPQWTFHTWARVTWNFWTRVYTLVYTRSCSACRLHLFVTRLDRIQLGSGHSKLLWSFFGSVLSIELTFDWIQQHLKFWLMVNFRLSYLSLPSASPSSKTREQWNESMTTLIQRKIEYASTYWVYLQLEMHCDIKNWVFCLNRGTYLNRLLISLSQNTKMQI